MGKNMGMQDELVLRLKKQARALFKEHDWYFDWSDDHRVWTEGHNQRRKIVILLTSLPQPERNELLKEVPKDCLDRLLYQIEKELKEAFESAVG